MKLRFPFIFPIDFQIKFINRTDQRSINFKIILVTNIGFVHV